MHAMYPPKSIDTYVRTVETAETTAFICFIVVYSLMIILVLVFVSSLATFAVLFRRYRVLEQGKEQMNGLVAGNHVQRAFKSRTTRRP